MTEFVTDPIPTLAVAAVIATLGYWRLTADERWFAPDAWFWFPLRRAIGAPLDRLLEPIPLLYAKTSVTRPEHVATLDITLEQLHEDLEAAEYEPQPLASIADDWNGRTERSSWARYYGPKYAEGWWPQRVTNALPEWTRRRQVHVRPFADDVDGPVTATAHAEYNPWRPLLALAHLLGIGLDREEGVRLASDDLGLERRETV